MNFWCFANMIIPGNSLYWISLARLNLKLFMTSWWCCHESDVDMMMASLTTMLTWHDVSAVDAMTCTAMTSTNQYPRTSSTSWTSIMWHDELSVMSSTSWTSDQVTSHRDMSMTCSTSWTSTSFGCPSWSDRERRQRCRSRCRSRQAWRLSQGQLQLRYFILIFILMNLTWHDIVDSQHI